MSEQNKDLYRRFIQAAFNEGKPDAIDRFLTRDYRFHDAPPGTPNDANGLRSVIALYRSAFPDLRITIQEQIAEGDKVCSRTTLTGTQKGPFLGLPASGRSVTMAGMTMVRIDDGRIAESWVRNDTIGLFKQLGMSRI